MEATTSSAPVSKQRLLVVDDDVPLTKFLRRRLEMSSLAVDVHHDGQQGYEAVNNTRYDLLILDLTLPSLDGLSFLKRLRAVKPKLPVLVLSGRSGVEDRVLSLDSGADDCLNKPFSSAELMARIRALLRRNSGVVPPVSKVHDLVVNREEWTAERNGRRIDLTPREFSVLELLIRNVNRPLSRAEILETVWNMPFDPSSNVVDVYVKYVRDKVDAGEERKLIQTVRGVGYMVSDK